VNGFNVVYPSFPSIDDSGWQICCNWCRLKPDFNVSAADKHNTPPGHFKLALGQPALLYALNGER